MCICNIKMSMKLLAHQFVVVNVVVDIGSGIRM